MFVASNQRRIPGNLYAVKKVVRSIHIDYVKGKGRQSIIIIVYVFMCVCILAKDSDSPQTHYQGPLFPSSQVWSTENAEHSWIYRS